MTHHITQHETITHHTTNLRWCRPAVLSRLILFLSDAAAWYGVVSRAVSCSGVSSDTMCGGMRCVVCVMLSHTAPCMSQCAVQYALSRAISYHQTTSHRMRRDETRHYYLIALHCDMHDVVLYHVVLSHAMGCDALWCEMTRSGDETPTIPHHMCCVVSWMRCGMLSLSSHVTVRCSGVSGVLCCLASSRLAGWCGVVW